MRPTGILMIALFVLGGLLQGCGNMAAPTIPVPNPSVTVPKPATPVFSSAVTITSDPAQLPMPTGIVFDGSQNYLYVSDSNLNSIYKMTPDGRIIAQWGNSGANALDQPAGLALKDGMLYVADAGNSRVVEYDSNGTLIQILQPQDGAYYLFVYPTGVSFDQNGNLYVSDNSDAVYRFDAGLSLTGSFNANGRMDFPIISAEDGAGNIYVANYNSDNILKFNPIGGGTSAWGGSGQAAGQFSGPSDIKAGPDGFLYVVDSGNARVQELDSNGNYILEWGQDGNSNEDLQSPIGLALGPQGTIYVTDPDAQRIVIYSTAK